MQRLYRGITDEKNDRGMSDRADVRDLKPVRNPPRFRVCYFGRSVIRCSKRAAFNKLGGLLDRAFAVLMELVTIAASSGLADQRRSNSE